MDDNSEFIEMVFSFVMAFWTLVLIFLICEPGEQVFEAFLQFDEELNQCDWSLLSVEMRRMYLIFLLDTVQPINIHCYDGILCTRNTFKTVLHISADH